MRRRALIGAGAAMIATGCTSGVGRGLVGAGKMEEMYGLIGQMIAMPGKRDELIAYLLAGTQNMPGNRAYIVGKDLADENAIWITEVWNTKTDHGNSLKLPSVQAAIAKGRPLIAGFGPRVETLPAGDWG